MLFLNLGDFGHGVDHLAKRAFHNALPPLNAIQPPLNAIQPLLHAIQRARVQPAAKPSRISARISCSKRRV